MTLGMSTQKAEFRRTAGKLFGVQHKFRGTAQRPLQHWARLQVNGLGPIHHGARVQVDGLRPIHHRQRGIPLDPLAETQERHETEEAAPDSGTTKDRTAADNGTTEEGAVVDEGTTEEGGAATGDKAAADSCWVVDGLGMTPTCSRAQECPI